MFQTGYYATGYHQTGYYLAADQEPEIQAPGRVTYGGSIPAKLPGETPLKETIERDDMDIIALVIAAIESGIIK